MDMPTWVQQLWRTLASDLELESQSVLCHLRVVRTDLASSPEEQQELIMAETSFQPPRVDILKFHLVQECQNYRHTLWHPAFHGLPGTYLRSSDSPVQYLCPLSLLPRPPPCIFRQLPSEKELTDVGSSCLLTPSLLDTRGF